VHLRVPSWPDAVLARCLPRPLVLHDAALLALFRRYARTLAAGRPRLRCLLLAEHLAWALVEALVAGAPALEAALHGGDTAWQRLAPALAHIEAHLGEPIAVADLGRCLGVGREQCTRLFVRLLGQTPVAYLRQRRAAQALHLLRGGAGDLDAVARACGLGNRQYLTRVCTAVLGQPPSRLRRPAG